MSLTIPSGSTSLISPASRQLTTSAQADTGVTGSTGISVPGTDGSSSFVSGLANTMGTSGTSGTPSATGSSTSSSGGSSKDKMKAMMTKFILSQITAQTQKLQDAQNKAMKDNGGDPGAV